MSYGFYPPIEPYNAGRLKVSAIHELYYEEVGNPNGVPIVFLHGGPGGGIHADYRRFFDPKHYRIVLFDQRGSGQSTPHAELKENTTWDLVADTEKIRELLKIDRWIVFGGSWGSTLALAYAETHPEKTMGLVLRGIFLCRKKDIHWFYQQGADSLFPDQWEKYLAPIPESERGDLVTAYYKRLTSSDRNTRVTAAQAWTVWEASLSKLIPDTNMIEDYSDAEFSLAFARIECHYFINGAFFEHDDQLLTNAYKIRHIPTEIVHGRYDVVCPIDQAWELKKQLPQSQLHIIADSGHSALEKGITAKLVEITERFKTLR